MEVAAAKRHGAARESLKSNIKALVEASDGTYGNRRMHAALVRGGEQAGGDLVRQLMREQSLLITTAIEMATRNVALPAAAIFPF